MEAIIRPALCWIKVSLELSRPRGLCLNNYAEAYEDNDWTGVWIMIKIVWPLMFILRLYYGSTVIFLSGFPVG